MEIPFVSATRRHHAIEHATIAVLFERRGRMVSVVGQSDPWGFTLRGPFGASEVESAAAEAIERLQRGESHLAVTPLCGTNLAVGGALAGGAALLAVGKSRRDNWSMALSAALLAMLAAGRIGIALQQHLTTDAAIGAARVTRVSGPGSAGAARAIRVSLRG